MAYKFSAALLLGLIYFLLFSAGIYGPELVVVARFAGAEPHHHRLLCHDPGVPRIVDLVAEVSSHVTPVAGARILAGADVLEEELSEEPLPAVPHHCM
ncbi:hypothetical protein CSAL01_00352 [Colletotrichum salicis]|uniref:Uncharacterized protein n=1 Tax=Colletotrichum salicis TaxID=1209931 RepID=A0A135RSW9_9PEZI|nr:hypothetical protein CSAL01_00352 [Colletotrichum salicis]